MGARRVSTDTPVTQTTTATSFTHHGIIDTLDYAAETIVCHNFRAGLIPPDATAFPGSATPDDWSENAVVYIGSRGPINQCQQARERGRVRGADREPRHGNPFATYEVDARTDASASIANFVAQTVPRRSRSGRDETNRKGGRPASRGRPSCRPP